MRNLYLAPVLVAALLASGCSMNPKLDTPQNVLPAVYAGSTPLDVTNSADADWRTVFRDQRLQRLIETALVNNHDLRTAILNVDAARAQYKISHGSHLPALDANLGHTRSRAPDATSRRGVETEESSANIGLSAFEVDLFGRLHSQSQAVFERYLATEEGRRAAQVTLIGAVAEAYVAERLAAAQLQVTEATLRDWRQSFELTRGLYQAGQTGRVELAQSEGLVRQAEADLESRRRALTQADNALQLVVGGPLPEDLPSAPQLTQLNIVTQLPAGLPSDLLTKRPDILQAERNLRAANADVGAARAAFFPRLSLTGSYGVSSGDLDNLFSGGNRAWSFGPQITVPLFRGGALKGELTLAQVRKSTAVVAYEKAVLTAFTEVANGLAARATYGNQIAAQRSAVDASALRLRLQDQRYKAGLDSRLELLDAQRSDFSARQGLFDLQSQEYLAAVALYRSLGGGVPATSIAER